MPRLPPPATTDPGAIGRFRAGTSGFSYPGWIPRFYPFRTPASGLLLHYARQLATVELNNTFYQQPSATKVDGWLAATPDDFRFSVKAQRGGSARALAGAADPGLAWLTAPYRRFGQRLGAVLFRVPLGIARDDRRLETLLATWPADLPLVMEFQDPSWQVDETTAALGQAGAVLCITDLDDDPGSPVIRRTGPFLYLRLRRADYTAEALAAWADRLEPFLAAGDDVYVYFRHDEVGRGAELALALDALVAERISPGGSPRPVRT
jgi:uncharacterized protein YecE (DUF72 family)